MSKIMKIWHGGISKEGFLPTHISVQLYPFFLAFGFIICGIQQASLPLKPSFKVI